MENKKQNSMLLKQLDVSVRPTRANLSLNKELNRDRTRPCMVHTMFQHLNDQHIRCAWCFCVPNWTPNMSPLHCASGPAIFQHQRAESKNLEGSQDSMANTHETRVHPKDIMCWNMWAGPFGCLLLEVMQPSAFGIGWQAATYPMTWACVSCMWWLRTWTLVICGIWWMHTSHWQSALLSALHMP